MYAGRVSVRAFASLILAGALAAACASGDGGTADRPAATEPSAPALEGPALVYVWDPLGPLGEPGPAVYTAVPGEAPVERVRLPDRPYIAPLLVPSHRAVLVAEVQRLVLYDLEGAGSTVVWDGAARGLHLAGVAVSADDANVAIAATADPAGLSGELHVITMTIDGSDVRTIVRAFLPYPPGFRGVPQPVAWSADGTRIMYRGTVPCGCPVSVGVSAADGSGMRAVGEPDFWYPDHPLAAYAVRRDRFPGGDCYEPAHAISLLDLETGVERRVLETRERSIEPYEWSPDGRELLYRTVETRAPEEPSSRCEAEPVEETAQWWLFDVASGRSATVPSLAEAHRRWTGLSYSVEDGYTLTLEGAKLSSREDYVRVLGVIDGRGGGVRTPW